jgi:uncharacterized protein
VIHPADVIHEFYPPNSEACRILMRHSRLVADKALRTAKKLTHLNPDTDFIEQAAMLHDIGIFLINAPEIGCSGKYPYICHGYLGRALLEKTGLPKHALVCERHVGAGIMKKDIISRNLPIPERDMTPISLEEQIVCYADKFYSKDPAGNDHEKTVQEIIRGLAGYGGDSVKRFLSWHTCFENGCPQTSQRYQNAGT